MHDLAPIVSPPLAPTPPRRGPRRRIAGTLAAAALALGGLLLPAPAARAQGATLDIEKLLIDSDDPQAMAEALRLTAERLLTNGRGSSTLAWDIFLFANAPSDTIAGHTEWETWADADDVFGDPNCQPTWPNPEDVEVFDEQLLQQKMLRNFADQNFSERAQLRLEEELDGSDDHLISEVHLNRTAFNWLLVQELWNLTGQDKLYERYRNNRAADPEFPGGSIFIKAVWHPVDEDQASHFYTRTVNGQRIGLIAFHMMAKVLPQWLWATWEHVDNPKRDLVTIQRDRFGLQAGTDDPSKDLLDAFQRQGLDPAAWRNYRLNGVQTTFVDGQGRPTILANSIIEAGMTARSSCMTCHSRTTIGENGDRLSFGPRVGAPQESWFSVPSAPVSRVFLQLDFAASQARAQAPTGPCEDDSSTTADTSPTSSGEPSPAER